MASAIFLSLRAAGVSEVGSSRSFAFLSRGDERRAIISAEVGEVLLWCDLWAEFEDGNTMTRPDLTPGFQEWCGSFSPRKRLLIPSDGREVEVHFGPDG